MNVTGPTATLGDLVLDQPAAVALSERLGLDSCRGGRRPLEEHALFPACRALEENGDAGVIGLLEDDHETTGDALSALRAPCGGHDLEPALCATHRKRRALELDLHQHVHEEADVLVRRVRDRVAAAA